MSREIFQYISDIHIEHNEHENNILIKPISDSYYSFDCNSKKNLILAGDIGNPLSKKYWSFIIQESKLFDRVFLICGNHEYYGNNIDYINNFISKNISKLNLNNVFFLNNKTFIIDCKNNKKIKLIGSTLWSYIPNEYYQVVSSYMNDYKLIQNLSPKVSNFLFSKSKQFIEDELKSSDSSDYLNLVITHHAPSFNNTSEEIYKDKPTTHAFASDLDHLVEKSTYWIYGHTHHNYHGYHNISSKLKTNQLGYNWKQPIINFDLNSHILF